MSERSERVIPIAEARYANLVPRVPQDLTAPTGLLTDTRGRRLHDLRISVTDRCNFRCTYCMPKEVFDADYKYLPHASLLSFEEITRVAKIFIAHGVEKLRLTGGEPLLRKNIEALIEMLAALRTPAGKPLDLTLTTNASLLAKKAHSLKAAGLNRVTVSLDALDDATFKRMNDVDFPVADVLAGIDAAQAAGFDNIKVNMVVQRGVNDAQIVPMAKHFKGSGIILRFIEFMDVGASNGWKMDSVVPSAEVIARLHEHMPLTAIDPNYAGEVAERWRYADGSGEIGVISSVTQAFCGTCTRARLSTEGKLYLCLFAQSGYDLRTLLRDGTSDEALATVISDIWGKRKDNYSEVRSSQTAGLKKIEMSYIGG
ncbi:MAG: GTP 3',8-cyclase MoaA [Burkholderiaceae bacterium]